MKRVSLYILGTMLSFVFVMSSYDFFINPKGGVFCADFAGSNASIQQSRICQSSGVSFATSLYHMGGEHMQLIKYGDPVFWGCKWVDDTQHKISLISGRLANTHVTYSCHDDAVVDIN